MTKTRRCKRARLFAFWLLTAACALFSGTAAAQTGTQRPRAAEQAVAAEAETRQALEAWETEKQQLLARIARHRARLQNLNWQHDKAADYSKTLLGNIAALERGTAAMEQTDLELLPLLDTTLDRLERFVSADIPWQPTVRRSRVASVRALLNDYDAALLPKTRAVLEALAREVDLGHGVAAREGEIAVQRQPRQVMLLHVGRVGLYALSGDGRHAYAWDPQQREFTVLDGGQRAVEEAMQMSEGTRIPALTRLPVDLPEPGSDQGGEHGGDE